MSRYFVTDMQLLPRNDGVLRYSGRAAIGDRLLHGKTVGHFVGLYTRQTKREV